MAGGKTGPNPTDRAKKGVKRSLLTEASGVPIGLAIDGANRHDCKMVKATIESIPVERPEPTKRKTQGMCLDKGYDSGEVRDLVIRLIFVRVAKRHKLLNEKPASKLGVGLWSGHIAG